MNDQAEIKAVVTDIEGTTSSLSFVKEVLFPYAYANLPDYVHAHEEEIADILQDVRTHENNPDLSTEEVIEVMRRWIEEDRKITPLKTLQGHIWKAGYEAGALEGHIYDDALEGLKRWKDEGLFLYVYSSGSVAAQKLLFGYTRAGDLTTLFTGYFDTHTGPKLEAGSYERIAHEIGLKPAEILFLSDHIGEIAAAADAGMNVIVLDRDHVLADTKGYRSVDSFDAIGPAMGLAA